MATRRRRGTAFERACEDARDRASRFAKGDLEAFDDAGPEVFVGLYAFLHSSVYGVGPGELSDTKTFLGARSAARKMLVDEFDGRQIRMVAFLQWVWTRERARMRTRAGAGEFRIGWRLQFASRTLVTDHRVSLAHRGRATK